MAALLLGRGDAPLPHLHIVLIGPAQLHVLTVDLTPGLAATGETYLSLA